MMSFWIMTYHYQYLEKFKNVFWIGWKEENLCYE